MTARFWIVAAVYHILVAAAALPRGFRWLRGLAAASGRRSFTDGLAATAVMTVTAVGLAVVGGIALGDLLFGPPRLLSQWIFGEGPLFAGVASVALWRSGRRAASLGSALIAAVLLGIYVDAYHIEPTSLRVLRHDVGIAGSASGHPLRLVHISDIQTSGVGNHERRAIRDAMALAPDLVVITGDFVHERRPGTFTAIAADLASLFREEALRAPLGVYGVVGNTDLGHAADLEGLGIRWLRDETVSLPLPGHRTLALTGLSCRSSLGEGLPEALLSRGGADALRIVAGHVPNFVLTESVVAHFDLALAGHTHGGQVVLPFVGPPTTLSRLPRGQASGLHERGPLAFHISRGVGMERGYAPQIRFLCPPEICLLTIHY